MIRVGIVGFGFIAKQHYEAYGQMKDVEVVAICTRSGIHNQHIPPSFNGKVYRHLEKMLDNEEIDLVDICTPTYVHEEQILLAASYGKHIICEKPLTLTYDAAKRIVEQVEKDEISLFVSHVLRFWPAYNMVKEKIGEAGACMNLIHAKRLSQSPTWSKWFQDPRKSGGALYDLHIHDIDYLLSVFGPVKSVYAIGLQNDLGAWDYVTTNIHFQNGQIAIAEASHRLPEGLPFTMSISAQSPKRMIEYQFTSEENIESRQTASPIVKQWIEGEYEGFVVDDIDPFQEQLAYFIHCIQTNTKNDVIPLVDVLEALHVLNAIEQSLEKKEIIYL